MSQPNDMLSSIRNFSQSSLKSTSKTNVSSGSFSNGNDSNPSSPSPNFPSLLQHFSNLTSNADRPKNSSSPQHFPSNSPLANLQSIRQNTPQESSPLQKNPTSLPLNDSNANYSQVYSQSNPSFKPFPHTFSNNIKSLISTPRSLDTPTINSAPTSRTHLPNQHYSAMNLTTEANDRLNTINFSQVSFPSESELPPPEPFNGQTKIYPSQGLRGSRFLPIYQARKAKPSFSSIVNQPPHEYASPRPSPSLNSIPKLPTTTPLKNISSLPSLHPSDRDIVLKAPSVQTLPPPSYIPPPLPQAILQSLPSSTLASADVAEDVAVRSNHSDPTNPPLLNPELPQQCTNVPVVAPPPANAKRQAVRPNVPTKPPNLFTNLVSSMVTHPSINGKAMKTDSKPMPAYPPKPHRDI